MIPRRNITPTSHGNECVGVFWAALANSQARKTNTGRYPIRAPLTFKWAETKSAISVIITGQRAQGCSGFDSSKGPSCTDDCVTCYTPGHCCRMTIADVGILSSRTSRPWTRSPRPAWGEGSSRSVTLIRADFGRDRLPSTAAVGAPFAEPEFTALEHCQQC
jgi:hypothetical protein